jgi:hypothetical protein
VTSLTLIEQPSNTGSGGAAALRRRLHAAGERPDFAPWGWQKAMGLEMEPKQKPDTPGALIGEVVAPVRTAPNGQRPLLHPIKVLHRGHDGYIAFALKPDGKRFRPSFSIKASALETMFPGYVDMLTCDSHVSINAAYTLACGDTQSDVGRPNHRNETLRYLCACYCDIDLYKVGLSFNQAYAHVMDMCEAGILPWASMVVNSGEGMWLLWLLHDHGNPDMPHRGVFSDSGLSSLLIYSQINKAIGSKLRSFGSDPNATDGARYIRVPGSFRTDKEKTIWWSIQGDGDRGFSYALSELADFFEVGIRHLLPEESEATAPRKRVPGRKSGQIVANKNRLNVMLTLMALRGGGFKAPHRDKGAWLYGMALYACNVPLGKAIASVRSFGRECEPPLPAGDCDSQTNSAYRRPGRWPYCKIASVLEVTREEAEIISQRIGKVFPCVDGPLVPIVRADGRAPRGDTLIARRREIERIVAEEGRVLPYRKMEEKLKARGHDVGSYISVRNDYKVLGLKTSRAVRLDLRAQHRTSQAILTLGGSLLPPTPPTQPFSSPDGEGAYADRRAG